MSPSLSEPSKAAGHRPEGRKRPAIIPQALPWLLLGTGLLAGVGLLLSSDLIVDEYVHGNQIAELMSGSFAHSQALTMPYTYHLAIAGPARLLGLESLPALRFLSLLWSLLALVAFFLAVRRLVPEDAALRTAQLFFLPIGYPFFFLLYTDVFSLVPLLFALHAVLAERPRQAGVFAILAVAVRQTNVVWLAFFFLLLLLAPPPRSPRELAAALGRLWVFLLGGALFIGFVVVNGGIVMGDRTMHSVQALHWENPLCSLVGFFFLFLPLLVARAGTALAELRVRPWWLALPVLAALAYFFAFDPGHPYNRSADFLFNRLAHGMASPGPAKILWFLPIAAVLLCLPALRLREHRFDLLFPFWLLSLLPAELITPRYSLPALAFFLLLRPRADRRVEWLLLALFVLLDAWLLAVLWQQQLFL